MVFLGYIPDSGSSSFSPVFTGHDTTARINVTLRGDTIPEGTFTYVPYSPALEDGLACGMPTALSTNDWKGKKVVLFAVPGAFTPTCHYDEFKAKGVDVIAVIAANDPFVMSGWARVEDHCLSDTDAKWSKQIGQVLDLSAKGLGIRTGRYAIIIDDLVVKYIGVEPAAGVTVSGAENILSQL
ncbi:thioredoxin-dependent peroxidase [Pholiota molesta]|nr:thioredoxin-dependent peroxidase [Pholiota molesta]